MRKLNLAVKVTKTDKEMGILWGYASVADIVDIQDEIVPQDELVRAGYQFMQNYYAGQAAIKVNHEELAEAVLVESTFHWLGNGLAWFVGVKLLSDELREAAKTGDISGFSIGGWAEEEPEEEG